MARSSGRPGSGFESALRGGVGGERGHQHRDRFGAHAARHPPSARTAERRRGESPWLVVSRHRRRPVDEDDERCVPGASPGRPRVGVRPPHQDEGQQRQRRGKRDAVAEPPEPSGSIAPSPPARTTAPRTAPPLRGAAIGAGGVRRWPALPPAPARRPCGRRPIGEQTAELHRRSLLSAKARPRGRYAAPPIRTPGRRRL